MQNERMKYSEARNKLELGLNNFSLMFRRYHILKLFLLSLIFITLVVSIIYPIYIIFYPSSLFVDIFWVGILITGFVYWNSLCRKDFKHTKRKTLEEKALLLESKFSDHDNLIINSLQIAEQNGGKHDFQDFVAQKITRDAADYINQKNHEFKNKIPWFVVKKLAISFLILCLIFAGSFAFAGNHVFNAMKHFFTLGFVLDDFAVSTRLTETLDWSLTPETDIELIKGSNLEINAIPGTNSEASNAFVYDTLSKENENMHPMNFNGNTFSFAYSNVQNDFKYFVASGHERSQIINVKVIELPAIETLALRIKYPEYTQKKDDFIEDFQGDIIALVGSEIVLHLKSTQPLKSAELLLNSQKEPLKFRQNKHDAKTFAVNLNLTQNDSFKIRLTNLEDRIYETEKDRLIRVLPDILPQIKIVEPSQNSLQHAINTPLPVMLRVFDDYGISQIKMIVEHANKIDEKVLFNNLDAKNVKQQMSAKFSLEFPEAEFQIGETIAVYFLASDYLPDRAEPDKYSKSRVIEIQIIEQDQADLSSDKILNDMIQRLNLLLNKQIETKKTTTQVIRWITRGRTHKLSETISEIKNKQTDIRSELLAISQIANVDEFPKKDAPMILEQLAGGAAYQIIKHISETDALDSTKPFNKIVPLQDDIIDKITALLETLNNKDSFDEDLSKSKENLDLSRKVEEKLENLKSKLDEFKKDQKRIIELTKELGKKATEDWTEEDDKIWEECKQAEDDWAKFFEDMRNDLSKLPDQDFSCSEVTEELNQIYQEVRNASDEVVKRNITIAVTREEAGLEIAEELENNLERWLSDTRDYIKWEMEEPTEEYDIPLSDLPDELEDIIGDLIDDEEDITEEVDDASSSWMDNLDKGAGWDAMDGPISNMSAKGVTGNQMPNSSEIGGRSGEGRTGRSSGQFVAEEATGGRGGRKTPTRDDGTAPETGQVKDKSNDQIGGATGGGKLSGDGGQGVRGESFPELQETMRRLQGKQADVLNRAEALKRELEKRRYPTEILDKTIEIMKMVDSELRDFSQHSPEQVKDRIIKIVTQLKQADTSIKDAAKLYQDLTRALPQEVRDQVTSAQDEKSPEKYKDLLDNYYRQLLKSK